MSAFARERFRLLNAALSLAVLLAAPWVAQGRTAQKLAYPETPRGDVVDDYHGTKVADPYRWLEDDDSPETVRWVDAENALTRSLLDPLPTREALRKRLTELYDYPRTSAPTRRGSRYFFSRNTGLQNQSVFYVQEGLKGAPRVLIDPNALSADGTVALTFTGPSEDGELLAYSLSRSGSDRQEMFVRDVGTGKDLPDRLQWLKFTGATWTPDRKGFYYARFPRPGDVAEGDENYYSKVYYHRLGESQQNDRLVFEKPDQKEVVFGTDITRDGRYLVIAGRVGASDRSEIYVLDRKKAGAKPEPLFTGFADAYSFIDEVAGRFYFKTNEQAPRGRVVVVDYAAGAREPREVIPQSADRLSGVELVNRKLIALYLHNARELAGIYSLDGQHQADVRLPGLGSIAGLTGRAEDEEMFLSFTSFVQPPTVYRYVFEGDKLSEFQRPTLKFRPEDYETRQVWYPSKDGTQVSMFLVYRKGLKLDGERPTFLSGYGGFNVDVTPSFRASIFVWLDQGGVYAEPNLRGGGEYGEEWHEAGMLGRKQNVFDDFIAASGWLIQSGYTRSAKLAIEGGSNGGLLVSACLTQRPDLFGAVLCRVPVADMLRYHRFTVGRFWMYEYGSAENPDHFPFLYRYSPYHNVKDGVAYPATLITTADHDDRVAPGHAKKLAARLQAATAGDAPILIRIETKAGHGGGKPISKRINEDLDLWSFLFWRLGVGGSAGSAG